MGGPAARRVGSGFAARGGNETRSCADSAPRRASDRRAPQVARAAAAGGVQAAGLVARVRTGARAAGNRPAEISAAGTGSDRRSRAVEARGLRRDPAASGRACPAPRADRVGGSAGPADAAGAGGPLGDTTRAARRSSSGQAPPDSGHRREATFRGVVAEPARDSGTRLRARPRWRRVVGPRATRSTPTARTCHSLRGAVREAGGSQTTGARPRRLTVPPRVAQPCVSGRSVPAGGAIQRTAGYFIWRPVTPRERLSRAEAGSGPFWIRRTRTAT